MKNVLLLLLLAVVAFSSCTSGNSAITYMTLDGREWDTVGTSNAFKAALYERDSIITVKRAAYKAHKDSIKIAAVKHLSGL